MKKFGLPRITERPACECGDEPRSETFRGAEKPGIEHISDRGECSELPRRAAPQSHGRKSVVRGLLGFAALIVFVIVCFLALVKWGESVFQGKNQSSIQKGVFEKLGIEKPEKGILAPDFSLEDLSGRRIEIKSLRGKVVFLNFWATWCVPCREEMPTMEKLDRELKSQGLEIVAVDYKEGPSDVRAFFAQLGLTFTALMDKEGKVSNDYGTWSVPLSVFINRKGELAGKALGSRRWDSPEAKAFIRGLLEGTP